MTSSNRSLSASSQGENGPAVEGHSFLGRKPNSRPFCCRGTISSSSLPSPSTFSRCQLVLMAIVSVQAFAVVVTFVVATAVCVYIPINGFKIPLWPFCLAAILWEAAIFTSVFYCFYRRKHCFSLQSLDSFIEEASQNAPSRHESVPTLASPLPTEISEQIMEEKVAATYEAAKSHSTAFDAALKGNVSLLRWIADNSPEVIKNGGKDSKNFGKTALHAACRGNQVEAVELLMDTDMSLVTRPDLTGELPILTAAKFGNEAVVSTILQRGHGFIPDVLLKLGPEALTKASNSPSKLTDDHLGVIISALKRKNDFSEQKDFISTTSCLKLLNEIAKTKGEDERLVNCGLIESLSDLFHKLNSLDSTNHRTMMEYHSLVALNKVVENGQVPDQVCEGELLSQVSRRISYRDTSTSTDSANLDNVSIATAHFIANLLLSDKKSNKLPESEKDKMDGMLANFVETTSNRAFNRCLAHRTSFLYQKEILEKSCNRGLRRFAVFYILFFVCNDPYYYVPLLIHEDVASYIEGDENFHVDRQAGDKVFLQLRKRLLDEIEEQIINGDVLC